MTTIWVCDERVEQFGELAAPDRVEPGGRLVEHEHVGLHRQHGGDRDATLLAAAEVMWRPVGEVGGTDGLEAVSRRASRSAAANAEVGRSEGDVVADGVHEQLIVRVLEHDTDPATDLGEVWQR